MPKCYYSDRRIRLYHGDALDISRGLGDELVNCIVTSPPYFGLRDYGTDGQYGLERSPVEYVENLRKLFTELRRVLADDGTLWLNLGDSYSAPSGGYAPNAPSNVARRNGTAGPERFSGGATEHLRQGNGREMRKGIKYGLPSKNLLGIPWRVAFALQDDGWILRNAIVWEKPNTMPESVTDRLSNRYEHMFLFSKSRRYWFDLDALREPHSEASIARAKHDSFNDTQRGYPGSAQTLNPSQFTHRNGKNPGDVWCIPTTPFSAAHFACFPVELAQRAILAGCRPGGTVLDPFSGSGTTGRAALNTKRRYIGIDINADYLKMSLTHPQRFGIENPKVRSTQ